MFKEWRTMLFEGTQLHLNWLWIKTFTGFLLLLLFGYLEKTQNNSVWWNTLMTMITKFEGNKINLMFEKIAR